MLRAKKMNYLILIIAAFYFLSKNEKNADFLSEFNAEDVLPLIKLLGINESELSSVLSVLPDLLSGNFSPAELIKKAAPLVISLMAKNKKDDTTTPRDSTPPDGFKPVESFIPPEIKNELSAFFE